jgi:hypothetical protein
MTISADVSVPIQHTDRFFISGEWVTPSSDSTITVIDSHTEQNYLTVAEAQAADMDRAISAAKEAFDNGPWPRLSHAERAAYLRALGEEVVKRSGAIAQMWPRVGCCRSLSPRPCCWTDRPLATATSTCRQTQRRGGTP